MIGQNPKFKTATFQFFFSQSHRNQVMDMKNVCTENPVGLSTTSRDASVGLCRKMYFSKYKHPFESDETFITEFCSQGLARYENGFPFIFESVLSRIRSYAELFSHILFVSVIR